ncbi:hypothetical protein EYC84_006039 [Monilinia fructicola]|uniref:2EXR domain-containing protein n=1 Tax=Monilinia fructicola TaxID=38448 RepID=A0A5M9K160_MONFR|nr:hypothetical protein EYC84_006039 [Monilinia fructicola]
MMSAGIIMVSKDPRIDQLLSTFHESREMAITTIRHLSLSIATLKLVPALTFQSFGKLSPEIRLKIWRASFEQRKLNLREEVLVKVKDSCRIDICFYGRPYAHVPFANRLVGIKHLPVTAFVDKQSRKETLKHYFRIFRTVEPYSEMDPGVANTIYFNPDMDTFFLVSYVFPRLWFLNPVKYLDTMFPPHDAVAMDIMNRIRCIEIYVLRYEYPETGLLVFETSILMALFKFAGLQQIVLVLPPDTESWIHTELVAQMEDIVDLEKCSAQVKSRYAGRVIPKITSREDECVAKYVPEGVDLPEWYNRQNLRQIADWRAEDADSL